MTRIYNIITISLITLVLMVGCKNEVSITPTEEAQQELLDNLQGTWTASEVRKESTVITDFNDFSITIADKSYTTANGNPVWPESGSFDFVNTEVEDEFIRQDGRLFTASASGGSITVTIIYNEAAGRGDFGTYEFVMEQE